MCIRDRPIDRVSAYEQLMQMKQQAEQEVAEESDKTTPTSAEHSGKMCIRDSLGTAFPCLV